jgi:hypothetical protein
MKLSELIAQLQEIKDQNGDLDVYIRKDDNDWGSVDFTEPNIDVSTERFGKYDEDRKNELIIG